jgi:hypothetical protein
VLLAVALALLGGLVAPAIRDVMPGEAWISNALVGFGSLFLWMVSMERVATRWDPLRSTRLGALLRRLRKGYVALGVAIAASVIAAFVFDGLQE